VYERILIPTDGSECSDAAVDEGVRLARALGSRVLLLYVVDATLFTSDIAVDLERLLRDAHRAADEALSRARGVADAASVRSDARVLEGPPARVIEREALECGLVVMGSHGRGWLARAALGSTTASVLHEVKRPVLVVRRPADRR
jgi:nucleotide-binding universal stress UspA family protein